MSDNDDKLSRRYRELPREEPSQQVDDLVLAASRRAVSAGPRKAGAKPQWMVPVSIAAVLVLGIGVSLRMQLEQPGIESSVPSSSSAEYPVPPAAEPAPQKPKVEAQSQPAPEASPPAQAKAPARSEAKAFARQDAAAPAQGGTRAPAEPFAKPLAKESSREAEAYAPKGFAEEKRREAPEVLADKPMVLQSPAPASPPVVILASPPPPPASATAAAPAPALRAKREAVAADNAAARDSRALGAIADPDPARELERIARLREAARHEEADRALAEFRRRHPDYRIPEAMWERVRAR